MAGRDLIDVLVESLSALASAHGRREPNEALARMYLTVLERIGATPEEAMRASVNLAETSERFPTPAQFRQAVLAARPTVRIVDPVYVTQEGERRLASKSRCERLGIPYDTPALPPAARSGGSEGEHDLEHARGRFRASLAKLEDKYQT